MIFVDESIQQEFGYICVGFAYCSDLPDSLINQAILQAGLTPGVDEYKSGSRMEGDGARQALRDTIGRVVFENCKLGLYIAPVEERRELCTYVAEIASRIVQVNRLEDPQSIFVDEGITGKARPSEYIELNVDCDSRTIPGIQLGDFVAYHCSYLLKCAISGTPKKILMADDEPHPLAGEEVELDWILRTNFRRNFFVEPRRIEEITGDDWFFKVAGYGAFFSPRLSEPVRIAAEETFDSMYFGCVW